MTNATPEQIRVYRHRKKVLIGVRAFGAPLAPIVGAVFFYIPTKSNYVSGILAFGGIVLVIIGIYVFQYLYFRCPACSHTIRLPGRIKAGEIYKEHCNNCGIDYAA